MQSEQIRDAVVAASWRRHDVIHSCCAPGRQKSCRATRLDAGCKSFRARTGGVEPAAAWAARLTTGKETPPADDRAPPHAHAGRIVLHEFTTKPRNADSFGQTPLSAALASSVKYGGLVMGVTLSERGRARRVLMSRC
jgi:hypothetical protein